MNRHRKPWKRRGRWWCGDRGRHRCRRRRATHACFAWRTPWRRRGAAVPFAGDDCALRYRRREWFARREWCYRWRRAADHLRDWWCQGNLRRRWLDRGRGRGWRLLDFRRARGGRQGRRGGLRRDFGGRRDRRRRGRNDGCGRGGRDFYRCAGWCRLVAQLFFEVLGGDLVKGAGGNPGVGDPEFLGLGQDLLALEASPFCDVVNSNRHSSPNRHPAGPVSAQTPAA
jgi:hypothetical protein